MLDKVRFANWQPWLPALLFKKILRYSAYFEGLV